MRQAKHVLRTRRKHCLSCQALFDSDPRSKGHQRYCSKRECQTTRQRLNEKNWRERNPDCLAYQQEQSRVWYKEHPDYSRQRRAADPQLLVKNRDDTRLRIQKKRRDAMFDKSKSILTQVVGGQCDKYYLTRGSGWLMVRLTKASLLSKIRSLGDNRKSFKSVANCCPKGKLYEAAGVF